MNIPFQFIPLTSLPEVRCAADVFPESFRLITWNLLAPCWKRTSYGRESKRRDEWEHRLRQSLRHLLEKDGDVICLQELWFEDSYLEIVRNAIEDTYVMYTLKRVHNKPDGLAILLRKDLFPAPKTFGIDFYDFGSRVGLMLVWDSFSLYNTHLTFPHNNEYDRRLRMSQVRDIQTVLNDYATPHHVVAGDLNGSIFDEAVSQLLSKSHLFPMIDHSDFVTHISHRGDKMACDLFLSSINCFSHVHVFPIVHSLSDHCIVQARIHVNTART